MLSLLRCLNSSQRGANAKVVRQNLVRRAFVLNSDDLGRRVVSGATFQFLGIALRTLITIGSTAILARLLSPADFGYIAMATVITEFAGLFSNFGFTNILIQQRVINRLQIDTVFWASLLLGAILTTMVFILSFFTGWLFVDPRIGNLLRVLCLTFLLSGFTSVPWAMLARLLCFRTEFWVQITSMASRAVVAILFAYAGFGVWSLVAGALWGASMSMVLYWVAVPYVPRFKFNLAHLTSTWRTSSSYLGGGLLYYINMNADLVLIGRYLGATQLGYYQNARSLTDEIRARIAAPLQQVLFPAFSTIQTNRDHLQYLFMRSARLLATAIFPIGFGVSATAADLVPVLYGNQWHDMIPIMTMFGISAALRGSTAIASPLFNASNRVGLALKYNVISTALMLMGVALTLQYGVDTVAKAVAFASLYPMVVFRLGLGLIGLDFRHMLLMLGPPAVASLVMWVAIASIRPFTEGTFIHSGTLLICHIGAGGLIYVSMLYLLSRQHLQDFKEVLGKLLTKF